MSVRVRFAPSPTGYLHVGGARTALYNYLYARAMGGTFVLRVEDTDAARSERRYEESQIGDLKWLGIEIDEGPGVGGDFGPYRQSERLSIYAEMSNRLIEKKLAYPCFCSEEELEQKKERAAREGRAPHYDGKCRNIPLEEALERIASGEKAVTRFKAPLKSYVFHDLVRDRIVFPEGMVGDFVIMRSDGMPVYNFCCVVDDMSMKITHVLRAEEHLPNTLRQLMIYEALEAKAPEFGHLSLLIGHDRQKLSKRHGATSVSLYREEGYLPQALVNYLVLLGWSHPEEKDIFDIEELKKIFTVERFSKSPAIFDQVKLNWVNGQHIKNIPSAQIVSILHPLLSQEVLQMGDAWIAKAIELYLGQVSFFKELVPLVSNLLSEGEDLPKTTEIEEVLSWENTPLIASALKSKLSHYGEKFLSVETLDLWTNELKKDLNVKGKFLFMGIRVGLTAQGHGSELKLLVPLIPVKFLQKRLDRVLEWLA